MGATDDKTDGASPSARALSEQLGQLRGLSVLFSECAADGSPDELVRLLQQRQDVLDRIESLIGKLDQACSPRPAAPLYGRDVRELLADVRRLEDQAAGRLHARLAHVSAQIQKLRTARRVVNLWGTEGIPP